MKKKKNLTNQEIGDICRELALLLHSGIGTADALALLCEETEEGSAFHELIRGMADQADEGIGMAGVFESAECFPHYACGLVRVGEESGRLEEALNALADHYEEQQRMEMRIRSALLYPAVLVIIMLAVIVVLLAEVLPVFSEVYEGLGSSLTGIAGGLLAVGRVLDSIMPVLCGVLVAVVVLLVLFSTVQSFRSRLMSAWQKRHSRKGVAGKMNAARFAQALAMGMASGLPMEEAVRLASGLMVDVPETGEACARCADLLEEGRPVSEAMRETDLLPASECRLLELGNRSGTGDTVMEHIAERMTEESENALETLVSRIEPTLVVITSILVGLILLSVMLPLMNIMAAIG